MTPELAVEERERDGRKDEQVVVLDVPDGMLCRRSRESAGVALWWLLLLLLLLLWTMVVMVDLLWVGVMVTVLIGVHGGLGDKR